MSRRFFLLFGLIVLLGFQKIEAQVISVDTVSATTITADTLIQEKTVKKTKKAQQAKKAQPSKNKKAHSPKKATIMSACLPGLGQIYNRKWWKVPIVYAGLGGLGYLSYSNYSSYKLYLDAYRYSTNDFPEAGPQAVELSQRYTSEQLQTYKESYRHDFELYTILLTAWYGLNIIDACVDGHLYSYDISDDLSFSIDPYLKPMETPVPIPQYAQVGLSFKLNF